MEAPKISKFPLPDLSSLPEDLQQRIQAIQEKTHFIPNVFLTLAHRPDELRAFMDYHDALMRRKGGLTTAEKEMIVVATSNANGCQYCVIAHGAILRVKAQNPLIADQVAINYKKADITDKQRAMLDFAMKVAMDSRSVEESDFETLTAHDFTLDDVWDIAGIAAFFGMSNRLANVSAMRPNPEFFQMGR